MARSRHTVSLVFLTFFVISLLTNAGLLDNLGVRIRPSHCLRGASIPVCR